ncbi:hypothetical protein [Vitiosangium sp. GDMCC 1.1324]|uniref:hypothetical protein n=1 Tax=Vitiosangium sp. (strain GDMCC 1.1324) TaxID=2138576 RepID=UPI000D332755|nr:hypothetical protein [Vitiosangium sp. GDMCC 1.1324]PTL82002.1 hypothetical protein DAT35_19510 [Vitiosangium sp. GDMCC 1.1324]
MLFLNPVTVPPFVPVGPPELSNVSEPVVRFDVLARVPFVLFPALIVPTVVPTFPSGVAPLGCPPSVRMSLRLGGNGMRCGHE